MSLPPIPDYIPRDRIFYPEGDERHPRILLKFQEKDPKLTHIFALYFDRETKRCNNDDTKTKLFTKFTLLPFRVLINTALKWAYHLSLIGIIFELGKTIFGQEELKTLGQRCWRELKDMVRTPLYGIALLGIALFAVAKALFNPVSLYDSRKTFRKWDLDLNWGDKRSIWINAPCFKSYNIFKVTQDFKSVEKNEGEITLSEKQEVCDLFDICKNRGFSPDPDVSFFSSILTPEKIDEMLRA